MKEKYVTSLRALLWSACGILPLPFGAFVSDQPYLASSSVLAFFVLSFAVPLWLGMRRRREGMMGEYASVRAVFYGGAVVLFMAVGILNALMGLDSWHSYPVRVLLFTLWMLVTLSVQYLAAQGVDFWRARLRKFWYSPFIDPIFFSLPLPCAILGMFLFPAVSEDLITQSLIIGTMAIMGFCFLGMSILVLATFAFYFFPYKRYGYTGKERLVHLLAIIMMGIMWVIVQQILFNSQVHLFTYVFKAMPVMQDNLLVFVTPFVLASVIIIGCVALHNVVVAAFTGK